MRSRAFVVLGVAFALAAVSVYLARAWIVEQAGQGGPVAAVPSTQVPVTRIVVAADPMPYGSKVLRHELRLAEWPVGSVPQGAFTSLDEVVGAKGAGAAGRVALRSLVRDEPVLKSKISGFGARASLSTLIAPGQRAATIRVNDINGVAGFVLPGDRVDVLLTRDVGGGTARRDLVTDVLLQNMKVLGIDQDANAEREQPVVVRAVTLEVTQPEAQKLTLAQKLGTLSLALRHANAADSMAPRTITARDLPLATASVATVAPELPAAHEPVPDVVPAPARPPGWSVRIVRGLDVSVYEVTAEQSVHQTEENQSGINADHSGPYTHWKYKNLPVQLPFRNTRSSRRGMGRREQSSDDTERLKYIADMLVELDQMARRCGHWELSLLIGAAALAAVELEIDITSSSPEKGS